MVSSLLSILLLVALLPRTGAAAFLQYEFPSSLISGKSFSKTLIDNYRKIEDVSFVPQMIPDFVSLQQKEVLVGSNLVPNDLSTTVSPELTLPFEHIVHGKEIILHAANSIDLSIIEGILLNDLSHIALDLATFIIAPENTVILRFIMVVGRLFGLLGVYLIDHSFRPDELAFQISMLGVHTALFVKSVMPRIRASLLKNTAICPQRRDVAAYRSLFEPAGLSWLQFRVLVTSDAIDWIDVEPNTQIESNEKDGQKIDCNRNTTAGKMYLYWLYAGSLKTIFAGSTVHYIHRDIKKSSSENDPGTDIGLLVDNRFFRELEKRRRKKKVHTRYANTTRVRNMENEYSPSNRQEQIVTGSRGATFMRINSAKLLKLMEHDDDLAASIEILVVKGLQQKLRYFLQANAEENSNIT